MPSVIGQDTTASGFDPGLANPAITFGVWGDSGSGTGVVGSSVQPAPAAGAGVYGLNNAHGGLGVRGQADDADGVGAFGESAQGTGVLGLGGGNKPGVTGTSARGTGVLGEGRGAGVFGRNNGDGVGVEGTSVRGVGVSGTTQGNSPGV